MIADTVWFQHWMMSINIRNIRQLILFLMSVLGTHTWAEESDQGFLSEFVTGSYLLLGKQVDSAQTFFGRAEIYHSDEQLHIKRIIDGVEIIGSAAVEKAMHGEATVLRMRFEEQGMAYENTCLIQSDLDNYARISCYRYRPGLETTHPGLEAWFIDHTAKAEF